MAVYTHIAAEELADLVARFGAGQLLSAKGIAEGVENSNYLIDTSQGRFILTVYEKRVDQADLPFFFAVIDHLVAKGFPVAPVLATGDGQHVLMHDGKATAMMKFMPGLSVSHPTRHQAHAVGVALAQMHGALDDFSLVRPNALGPEGWYALADKCGDDLEHIAPGLRARVAAECAYLQANWPRGLPVGTIHADLFPDNVLMVGASVNAFIDFTFACTDIRAWDLAVTHAAWCFDADGRNFDTAVGAALVQGYDAAYGRTRAEEAAFTTLARGACLRFLLTRAWDWLNTPPDALVVRKDPLAFLRRLDFYAGQ